MTGETRKLSLMAGMIIAFLCFSMGLLVLPQTISTETYEYTNDSIMSAEGVFDRIELVDRHYGSWNGQEVEGDVLAVLYSNGSVEISTEHYNARFLVNRTFYYTDGENYPFFLYIYDGVDHLRERISVEGGTSEDFVYLNMTVMVYLGMGTITNIGIIQVGILYSTSLWLCSAFFVLVPIWYMDGEK